MQKKRHILKNFDELAAEWSQLYGEGNSVKNYLFIVRKKRAEGLLDRDVRAGLRILDIGCGSGVMAPYFAQKGAIYLGIDISEKMIAQAKKEIGQIVEWQDRVLFAQGDIKDLDFPNDHFDIVIVLDVLEYIEDRETAIREIVRVARNGGSVLIAVPNKACVNQMARRWLRPIVANSFNLLNRVVGKPVQSGVYYHPFHPKELESLLEKYGCKKTGEAFYDLEILFYPFYRIFPGFALCVKNKVETYYRMSLRHWASGYMCRVKKT